MIYRLAFFIGFLMILFHVGSAQGVSVSEVQDNLVEAFEAVREAEQSGADTTDLVQKINLASELIRRSAEDPRMKDAFLNDAQRILSEVVGEANAKSQESGTALILQLSGGTVAIALGIVGYFKAPRVFWLIWIKTKRNYLIRSARDD